MNNQYQDNGSKTRYYYDAKTFRLTRLLTTRNTGQDVLQDLNYTYDPVGNITQQVDNAQQIHYFSNSVIEPKGMYKYDALYRLTEAKGRELTSLQLPTHDDFANNLALPNTASNAMQNYTQQYTYDELGNINQMKSVGNWTRDYYYNFAANNYLLGHTENTIEYTYDAHGNMLTMPHLQALSWDFKDELKTVTLNAGGDTAYYVYDASGNRVRKVIVKGNIVEERYYLGDYELYKKTNNGTVEVERSTVHVSDDKKRIAQIDDDGTTETIRYQYDNHLGSASLELDQTASIISYEEYHPFGTTSYRSGRTETETSLKRYKYVGKERDEETGLYYYGARYYAAWMARFVSVDPLQHKYPYYTPYQYAGNKPITFIDLDGLEPAEVKSKTQVYEETKKTVSHIDSILKNLTIKDLGGNPLNRFEAQEMFHKAKTALEEGLFITGAYEKGFKFNSEAWKESYLKEKGLTRADFKGIDHNSKLAQDFMKDIKNAKSVAELFIKNSPFFTLFPKETTVYMGNSKDKSIDWGKVGSVVDWVGIGIEGVGYVMVFIPVVQAASPVVIAAGKGLGYIGSGMEIYGAYSKEEYGDVGIMFAITLTSEIASIPMNSEMTEKIVDRITKVDRAVYETAKNATLEEVESNLTKKY